MIKIHDILFAGSYGRARDLDYSTMPECAWVGRSNVGKSSLVNYVLGRRQVARVSGRAGKTLRLNQYVVNQHVVDGAWALVDMPGYGWAQVSKAQRQETQRMRQDYLKKRKNLVVLFVLIDSRHIREAQDKDFLAAALAQHLPLALVFTKADKLSAAALRAQQQAFLQVWDAWFGPAQVLPPLFITSSLRRRGKEALLAYIEAQNKAYRASSTLRSLE